MLPAYMAWFSRDVVWEGVYTALLRVDRAGIGFISASADVTAGCISGWLGRMADRIYQAGVSF